MQHLAEMQQFYICHEALPGLNALPGVFVNVQAVSLQAVHWVKYEM